MDKDFLKELINLIKGSDIKVFELEQGDLKIKIETHQKEVLQKIEVSRETKHIEAIPISQEIEESKLHVIKSPLVGTFYRAPSPGAPPFVEVGDMVSPGQVICIIEALKVMNEIESDVRGKVVKILVENGETVEYGQPLFLIDTNV
ncbi:acetyl-CoA carboxylase biotin carboxyl carrier protein [Thermocrinis sp.]|uniref:acetyl-CoA carboxylase biotin carboxyl carrier protein n=1 Tax=Thermocrinis sp. TaxID=2024383 RepID=UPI002FDE8572